MRRLTATEYLFIILTIILLAGGLSYGLQSWLTQVNAETGARIERAGRPLW